MDGDYVHWENNYKSSYRDKDRVDLNLSKKIAVLPGDYYANRNGPFRERQIPCDLSRIYRTK